jgi:starch synthase
MSDMKILIASSEAVPFIKTGGLGDVAGTLVSEYRKSGIDASTILPLYKNIRKSGITPLPGEISVQLGDHIETGRIWKGKHPGGADAYFIQNDKFYDREEIYSSPEGDYPDNASRFIFYSRSVLEAIKALHIQADIIHCNDWQTGLIPVYLKTTYRRELPETSSILSIHNIGYQGIFDTSSLALTGLHGNTSIAHDLELNGKLNFLKAGILYADRITTVSSNYAREIQFPEYGFGLEGVLHKKKDSLRGIINGIDYNEWNPRKDKFIPATYGINDLSGKARCKKDLVGKFGLQDSESLLIGMVSRLASQKGFDLVSESMDEIIKSGAQMIILGKGDESLHRKFMELHNKYNGRLSVILGFNNALAHRIYAGSDVFLMPSKYEPCGLGQLIALRYGTIPVARKTGGLADTIEEYNPVQGSGTGFLFNRYSSEEMLIAIKRAEDLFNNKRAWKNIRNNAMSRDFSWAKSAEEYISLFRELLN